MRLWLANLPKMSGRGHTACSKMKEAGLMQTSKDSDTQRALAQTALLSLITGLGTGLCTGLISRAAFERTAA